MTLTELLEKEGFTEACITCQYFKEWVEAHETFAVEHMCDCVAPTNEDCKRLITKEQK
jgi:hypothetical protein